MLGFFSAFPSSYSSHDLKYMLWPLLGVQAAYTVALHDEVDTEDRRFVHEVNLC